VCQKEEREGLGGEGGHDHCSKEYQREDRVGLGVGGGHDGTLTEAAYPNQLLEKELAVILCKLQLLHGIWYSTKALSKLREVTRMNSCVS
jgi:hypothetical protein